MTAFETTAERIGTGSLMVQNLGPDDLYIGVQNASGVPALTSDNGFQLVSGESASIALASGTLYGISAGTSEVRTLSGGTGVYSAVAPA